jgi:hypothetical protein
MLVSGRRTGIGDKQRENEMAKNIFARVSVLLAVAALTVAGQAQAAVSYSGPVGVIEVWAYGNVAFKLSGVSGTCGGADWFVINKSTDGGKNLYAALLAAKLADKPIRIYSDGCGPADGFGSAPYVQVSYLYID